MVQRNRVVLGKDVISHPPSSNFLLERIMSDALEEHDGKVNIASKLKLVRCPAISIFLSTCESEILTAELEKRTQDFEMRCNRRLRTVY